MSLMILGEGVTWFTEFKGDCPKGVKHFKIRGEGGGERWPKGETDKFRAGVGRLELRSLSTRVFPYYSLYDLASKVVN